MPQIVLYSSAVALGIYTVTVPPGVYIAIARVNNRQNAVLKLVKNL